MYNRYIPQSDGSYRRRSMPEQPSRPAYSPPPPEPEFAPPPPVQEPCAQCPSRPQPRRGGEPEVGSFLKNLLPGNFDTEDLLIVVLLLLMSGEGREDRNLPLLTLALYLFL